MFDIKKTSYLIIIHPTSIFRIKNKMQYKKYSLYLHPMKMFLFAPNCFFFNSLFLAKKNILKCDKHVEPILNVISN